ncbi:hypothetical protein BaRGS_00025276 [Batillaria attramentaria]|uniref:TGF-beta family profile domain-containing protein n=1 Tax=Batillaria attramentaria TaxID=370345 RepID=A0ABD0K8R3_9CAEN
MTDKVTSTPRKLPVKLCVNRVRRHRYELARVLPKLPRHLLLASLLVVLPSAGTLTPTAPTTTPRTSMTSLRAQRRSMLAAAGPEFVYMSRLYDRMKQHDADDSHMSDFAPESRKQEYIAGTYAREGAENSPWLTFNISGVVHADDNITLAEVAIATKQGYRRNTCLHVRDTNSRLLKCRLAPLNTQGLMTFDVTSKLKTRQSEDGFSVYLEHMHHAHVEKALLVIFRNIDTEQLFNARRSRQRPPALIRSKRQTTSGFRPLSSRGEHADVGEGRGRFVASDEDVDPSDITEAERRRHRESGREIMLDTVQTSYARYQAARRGTRGEGSRFPFHEFDLDMLADRLNQVEPRLKRQVGEAGQPGDAAGYSRPDNVCQVRPFVLHAEDDLQWYNIIHPTEFILNMCWGDCPPVLPRNGNQSNFYSYLTSLFVSLHPRVAANRNPPILPLRCLPRRFETFSVMLEELGNYVVQRWHNARVVECGCA